MPKIEIPSLPVHSGTGYPAPFADRVRGRSRKKLGDAVGLTQFGVNLTTLQPGAESAIRHWHENEDELVWIVSGEVVLIEDEGETVLGPGDAAGFKAGVANGHHLVNRSDAPATYLEIGTRAETERGHYPDDDLAYAKDADGFCFTRKSGDAY